MIEKIYLALAQWAILYLIAVAKEKMVAVIAPALCWRTTLPLIPNTYIWLASNHSWLFLLIIRDSYLVNRRTGNAYIFKRKLR